jgi:phage shock protein C
MLKNLGIERSRDNRMLMGVCGGLAAHFGISPRLVRIFTAVAALIIPGVSFVMVAAAYIVLAILLPEEDGIRV